MFEECVETLKRLEHVQVSIEHSDYEFYYFHIDVLKESFHIY